jgi:hypothetical protein
VSTGKRTYRSPAKARFWALSSHQWPGAPHLARFSRDVGYHSSPPHAGEGSHNSTGVHSSTRVPYVRTSVRGPKTMGEAQRKPFVPNSMHRFLGSERNVMGPAVLFAGYSILFSRRLFKPWCTWAFKLKCALKSARALGFVLPQKNLKNGLLGPTVWVTKVRAEARTFR